MPVMIVKMPFIMLTYKKMKYRFCKNFVFLSVLLGGALLHSQIVQPQITPEQEEAIVNSCGSKPSAPLSKALQELIQGISNQTFGKDLFEKIIALEKKKFTGEFVDYWENGQCKIKAFFKNGKVDGHVHGWFPDGNEAFKGFFYENTKAGVHIAFHPKGAPRWYFGGCARILSYDYAGLLDGEQRSKEYDGKLKTFIAFKHGVPNGSRILYNQDRKCIKDEFYEDGKFIPGKTTEKRKR